MNKTMNNPNFDPMQIEKYLTDITKNYEEELEEREEETHASDSAS